LQGVLDLIYFTSDLHHEHKHIVKYTNRHLETTQEEHSDWLVEMINTKVNNADTLWHLGDFSFSTKYEEVAKFTRKLKGQKFFIKGNHDRSKILDRLKEEHLIQDWYHYKEIKLLDHPVALFHFPVAAWHKQGYGSLHLHGHSHGSYHGAGKILDVGIDNYYNVFEEHGVFSQEQVLEYMQQRETAIYDHHKER
jgi:calcineurin-like phosphoesterase family protein